jgi:hypothetical protein
VLGIDSLQLLPRGVGKKLAPPALTDEPIDRFHDVGW